MANIHEITAYYDHTDWAQCACNVVRKFGIAGVSSQVKALRDVRDSLSNISDVLSGIGLAGIGLDDIMTKLIPGNFINRLSFQQLQRFHICPLFSDLVRNIVTVDTNNVDNFFKHRHEWLQKRILDKVNKINNDRILLLRLENLISVMEGCVSSSFSEGKTYKNEILSSPIREKNAFPGISLIDSYHLMNANVIIVNGEVWIVYEKNKNIFIQRKVDGIWIEPMFMSGGDSPTLFFDGTYIKLYWVYNTKIQEAKFQPHELGQIFGQKQLWDCIKYFSGHATLGAKNAYIGCEGKFISYEGTNLISFPDGGKGIYPTANIYTNPMYNYIKWPVVNINGFTTSYEVYKDNTLVYQTSNLIYDNLLLAGINYHVVVVYTDVFYGREYRSCKSNIIATPLDLGRAIIGDSVSNDKWSGTCTASNFINYEMKTGIGGSSFLETNLGSQPYKEKIKNYQTIINKTAISNIPIFGGAKNYTFNVINFFGGTIE